MRFRPLRPASAPDSAPIAVADPPEKMRAAVIDATGRRRRAARGIRRRAHARCSANCSYGSWPRASTRSTRRRAAEPGCPERSPHTRRPSASTSAASWCARPTSPTRCPPARPSSAWLPFPRSGGSYAEYAVVPSQSVARKPTSLSHVEAAGVPLAALTAWGLVVETAHAHEGQRMLIHAGSGGVGHFAVQFAAYFGAHVTATGSSRNASWLRELGASVVIDYSDHPLRGGHRRRRRRHRPRRATCTTRPASAR